MTDRQNAIIRIVITAAVNIVNLYGFSVDADALVTAATTAASFATIAWAWWKNNNVTQAASQIQALGMTAVAEGAEEEADELEDDDIDAGEEDAAVA